MYDALISTTYTHFMNMLNTSFRVAFYFNKSDSKPNKKEIKDLLYEVTNLDHTQSLVLGKDSVYVSSFDGLATVLSEISKEKINDVLPYKKEWQGKKKLLEEYIKHFDKAIKTN